MKKNLTALIVFLIISWGGIFSQSNPFIITKLDQATLQLRNEALHCTKEHISQAYSIVLDMWNQDGRPLIKAHFSSEKANPILSVQNARLNDMKGAIAGEQFGQVAQLSDDFFSELVNLRSQFEEAYPLDQLWRTKMIYEDLKNVIHDQMLELLEWNEIDRSYDKLDCSWQEYELFYQDLLPVYYPDLDVSKQKAIFSEMAGCLERLRKALDTGYRPDFILPCDEIGVQLEENLKLFLPPHISDL